MPTVLIIYGVKFYFYSNEGSRPHIHVKYAEYELQVWLDDLSIKKECVSNKVGKELYELVEKNKDTLISSWNEFFGVNND
jgi:hypothetical protein